MVDGHGGVEDGGVSLGLSLADGGLQVGAGSNGQGASVGVFLLVKSGGTEEGGDFMNSSLEVTVVSSLGLGHDLVIHSQWLDGNCRDGVGVGGVGVSEAGVEQLGLSRPLAIVANDRGVD